MADTPNDLPQRPGTRGRERLGTLAGGFHFRGTSASNTPLSVDAARMRDARLDPRRRAAEQQRDTAARAAAREDPEYGAAEQQHHRDPEGWAVGQHHHQDPERRAAEQQRNTAARAAARQDPERRAAQQQCNTAARAAARQDPEQERDTAAHAQGRAQVHAIQHPQASLLERLRNLMRFPCLHEGQHPRPPDFLEAIPEGRVQDLPGGELPVDRQCSEEQSTLRAWLDIPNVDLLRADIMCTAAVPRHAHPVLPARYRIGRSERASSAGIGGDPDRAAFVDEDALAVDSDVGDNGTNEPGAADDAATMQLPPELQPHPPRVQPRPCVDDPISVEVPFCMRLDTELPNRTVFRHDDAPDEFTICTSCEKALAARRIPEAALARLDPGDVPSVNHLGDPLPAPTFVESQLLGRGRLMQQLMIVHLAGRPPEVLPCAVQSHGIAVVNPDPNMLRGQLPARVADLAGAFTVVCVDQVRDRQDLLDRVRRAPGLKVRGNVVVAWVRFLQHNDEDEGAVDEEAIQEYERMGCIAQVPEALLRSAIGPTDPEVAGVLRSTFLHDRTGAAGVRQLHETLQGNIVGNNFDGGGVYGSPLETAFQWVGTTGLFLLPRLASNLVPHMPAIALAFGCNHLMSLACEVDRDYTADIAAQLARPINERGDCPLLQPAIDRARDAAYYSSKYTAKTIERSQAHLTCTAVGRVQDFMMAGHQPSATGHEPSVFGNLCTAVHRMTATITAGMALVAFKLSGHDTFQATYKRNYLATGAFTALASDSAVEPEDAETGVELVEADEHGDYTLANVVQNYTQRGVELSGLDCSTYTIASNFEVKRVTPAQHPHAAVLGAQTHAVPGRRKRKVPGAAITPTTDAPRAPSGNQPDTPLTSPAPAGPSVEQLPTNPTSTISPKNVAFQPTHPLYLTHVLHRLAQPGVFKAHRGQPVAADQTVKEAYDAWWMDLGTTETGRSYRACISVLLDNIEAEHIAGARRQADYNLRRRLRRTAAANAGLAPENSSSDPDDEDPEAARRHLEPDPTTQPPQDAQLERYDFVPGQGDPTMGINLPDIALTDLYDRTTVEGLYAYGAARRCRVLPLPDALGANTNPFIRRVRATDVALLSEASKRLKRYLVVSEGTTTTPTTTERTPRLQLDRRPGYPLVAVLVNGTQQSDRITAGMPTYLRLARPPTIDETIELFTLAPDQAVPFMLMARYFDRRNQPDPGVPPQMLVMGPPGTGKTQFVHALLWYTYQHDSPDWAATCAYSWAAAIAFNTPVHRSLSTHSMFGISASQSGSRGTNFPKRGAHAGLQ
ncbi:hypothetical protein VOLCADRAFT_100638, partial [Volvox carteri f. nagariensis]